MISFLSLFLAIASFGFEMPSTLAKPGAVYFECTIVSEINPMNLKAFSHLRKYSAIRADILSSSEVSLSIGGKNIRIPISQASKKILSKDHEKIDISFSDGHLTLDLRGKPLSRNGALEIRPQLGRATLSASVTCH